MSGLEHVNLIGIPLDLVEVNPILDEQNRTAELACERADSLLGKSVL